VVGAACGSVFGADLKKAEAEERGDSLSAQEANQSIPERMATAENWIDAIRENNRRLRELQERYMRFLNAESL
jgi:hypothetical protein